MTDRDLLERYNYDAFVPEKFEPWMRFAESPPLAEPAPDFPLRTLDGAETSLAAQWKEHRHLVVEFGSFT
ncbi:hypothetical protein K8I85_02620 [bacterium]|nr:hypothetical protein [bacterium]